MNEFSIGSSVDWAVANNMADIFISYSRKDIDFVRRLHDALEAKGRSCWVDWDGIPPTAEWMTEIEDALRGSDAFMPVLSPDWAESRTCIAEHAIAQRHGKRVVQVQCRDLAPESLPGDLAKTNWVRCRPPDDFDAAVARVLEALELDLEHVKMHTRLEQRAAEWSVRKNDASLTLRGTDLEEAERWLAAADSKDPPPTTLQRTFIADSRAAAIKRRRILMVSVGVALMVAVGLGTAAWRQSRLATTRGVERDQQAETALARKLRATAADLARIEPQQLPLAVLLGIEAVRRLPGPDTEQTLYDLLAITIQQEFAARHEKPVQALAFDSQDASVVSISSDGAVKRTTAAAGRESRVDATGAEKSSALSSSGRWAAVAPGPGAVAVLDTATGQEVKRIEVPGEVRTMAIGADGQLLAVTGGGAAIVVHSLATGELLRRLSLGANTKQLAFSQGGRFLAGTSDSATKIWNASTGAEVATLAAGGDHLVFSDDETQLAIGGIESAAVYEVPSGREVRLAQHFADVGIDSAKVAFNPAEPAFATAVGDTVRLWSLEHSSAESYLELKHVGIAAIAFSPDGHRIATAGSDGTARIWDLDSGIEVARAVHGGPVTALRFNAVGSRLATASEDGTVVVWSLANPWRQGIAPESLEYECGFAVSADAGNTAFPTGADLVVRNADGGEIGRVPRGMAVALSANGLRLVTADYDGSATVYELPSGRPLRKFTLDDQAHALGLDRSGRYLGVAEFDHFAIWDTDRGERITRVDMRAPNCASGGLAMSAAHAVVATMDDAVVVYELATAKAEPPVEGGGKSVALSADGRFLAVHRGAGAVVVIDRQSRQAVATLAVEPAEDVHLAFSLDGRRLAIATTQDHNGLLVVFDVTSGKEMHRSTVRYQITTLALAPDGRSALTSRDVETSVQRRLIDPALLIEAACARMSRGLSEAEWKQYLPGLAYAPVCRK